MKQVVGGGRKEGGWGEGSGAKRYQLVEDLEDSMCTRRGVRVCMSVWAARLRGGLG